MIEEEEDLCDHKYDSKYHTVLIQFIQLRLDQVWSVLPALELLPSTGHAAGKIEQTWSRLY